MDILILQAIQALPDEYVISGTEVAHGGGMIVACNPLLPIIAFKDCKWFNIYPSRVYKSEEDNRERNLIVRDIPRSA